jgi:hypothetical protein
MSYTEKLEQEISSYRDVVNVSELPEIYSYWSNKFLRPKLESLGFSNPNEFYIHYIRLIALAAPKAPWRPAARGRSW